MGGWVVSARGGERGSEVKVSAWGPACRQGGWVGSSVHAAGAASQKRVATAHTRTPPGTQARAGLTPPWHARALDVPRALRRPHCQRAHSKVHAGERGRCKEAGRGWGWARSAGAARTRATHAALTPAPPPPRCLTVAESIPSAAKGLHHHLNTQSFAGGGGGGGGGGVAVACSASLPPPPPCCPSTTTHPAIAGARPPPTPPTHLVDKDDEDRGGDVGSPGPHIIHRLALLLLRRRRRLGHGCRGQAGEACCCCCWDFCCSCCCCCGGEGRGVEVGPGLRASWCCGGVRKQRPGGGRAGTRAARACVRACVRRPARRAQLLPHQALAAIELPPRRCARRPLSQQTNGGDLGAWARSPPPHLSAKRCCTSRRAESRRAARGRWRQAGRCGSCVMTQGCSSRPARLQARATARVWCTGGGRFQSAAGQGRQEAHSVGRWRRSMRAAFRNPSVLAGHPGGCLQEGGWYRVEYTHTCQRGGGGREGGGGAGYHAPRWLPPLAPPPSSRHCHGR